MVKVKTKERKRLAIPRGSTPRGSTRVSNSNFELDLHGDDTWVIVKKQKVTVLVPPPPTAKALPGSEPEKGQTVATKWAKARSEVPPSTHKGQNGLVSAHKKGSRLNRDGAIKFMEQTLTQRLRALNLERKLAKAGGLSRWLASLGLGQFVRIFERKSISKFHLVNMTMKKLKDMGANAVGPRRKLMHAIDCICQPYCFDSLEPIFDFNASKRIEMRVLV